MGARRRRTVVSIAAGIVLLLAGTGYAVSRLVSHAGTGAGSPTSTKLATTGGPAMPTTGSYLGAWVKPDVFSQDGRVAAVDAFERDVGRRLDIVHVYHKWEDPFPTASDLAYIRRGSLLQLSWAGTDTTTITSGQYDTLIQQRAKAIKAVQAQVFMEWRWEMDRPNLAVSVASPTDFIQAWRHIRSIFAAEGVRNAGWVWCPTADGFANGRAGRYYPGDDQVDWLCADVYPPGKSYRPFAQLVGPFLRWAAGHPRPIMIGEFGAPVNDPARRASWLRAAAATVREHPQIKALVYFNANPERPGGPVPQYDLGDDPPALAAFRLIATDGYFNQRRSPASGG